MDAIFEWLKTWKLRRHLDRLQARSGYISQWVRARFATPGRVLDEVAGYKSNRETRTEIVVFRGPNNEYIIRLEFEDERGRRPLDDPVAELRRAAELIESEIEEAIAFIEGMDL